MRSNFHLIVPCKSFIFSIILACLLEDGPSFAQSKDANIAVRCAALHCVKLQARWFSADFDRPRGDSCTTSSHAVGNPEQSYDADTHELGLDSGLAEAELDNEAVPPEGIQLFFSASLPAQGDSLSRLS